MRPPYFIIYDSKLFLSKKLKIFVNHKLKNLYLHKHLYGVIIIFVTTSGRSGAPKALRTATYDGKIIYNDPVCMSTKKHQ
jgi:hypothetical protein